MIYWRWQYLIKKTTERNTLYTLVNKYECVRICPGDLRILDLYQKYDWNLLIHWNLLKPTEKEEIQRIREWLKAYTWNDEIEIIDIGEAIKKDKELK